MRVLKKVLWLATVCLVVWGPSAAQEVGPSKGSLLIVGLFVGLILRLLFLAERQRSMFHRLFIYGVASIIFMHFLINIGMTIGLVPVIGIPLPFISYGGSSLISFTLMIATVIKMDSDRLLHFR